MPKELIDLQIVRKRKEPWGFRLIGGRDEGLVLKVEKVKFSELDHPSLYLKSFIIKSRFEKT